MSREIGMSVKMSENDKKRWERFCGEFNGTNKEFMGVLLDLHESNKLRNSKTPVDNNLALFLDKIDQIKNLAINTHNIAKAESDDSKEKLKKCRVESQDLVNELKSDMFKAQKSIKMLTEENKSLIEIKTSRDQVYKTCENMQIIIDDLKEKVGQLENDNENSKNELLHAQKIIESYKENVQEERNKIIDLKNTIEQKDVEIRSKKENIEGERNAMQCIILEKDLRIDDLKAMLDKSENTTKQKVKQQNNH